MNSTDMPSSKLWTMNFIFLTLCNLCVYLNLQMITPSLPAYVSAAFGSSGTTISFVISLFAVSAIATRLFAGTLFELFGQRRLMFIGLIVFAVSTAGYALMQSMGALLVLRIVYGIGFAVAGTAFGTLASEIIPKNRMGEGMGYFGLSTSLSMSVAPVIGLWLLNGYGFGTLIAVSSALAVVVFPLAALIRFAARKGAASASASAAQNVRASGRGHSGFWEQGAMFPCGLNLLLSVTYGGLITFIALFGQEVKLGNVGWFFLFNALMVLIVRPFSGKLFDRKGHAAVLPAGALFTALGLVLLSFASGMPMLIASALCYGIGYGMLQPSLQAWTIQRSAPERRAVATGMFYNSIDLGIAVGSVCLGFAASGTGYAGMYRLSALSMLLFLIFYVMHVIGSKRKPALSRTQAQTRTQTAD
ncbi:Inner membrane transport protein YdhC [Paenibacillus konkukensis]|uniref:Inner membrane transport protein YdhC n=1 Tax=Paenibacillus konkukensis TaxID=2020716 RepID=A0ABY4RKC8_9BACL|nr:MFS transporter [Paenibacillus konkukensis]UQZ82590.1 Inner membrane transport protein YdhC [Paenibacillus konkukensis]